MSERSYVPPLSASPDPVYILATECKYGTHVVFALDEVVSLEATGDYSTAVSLSSSKEVEVLVAFHVLSDLLAERGGNVVSLLPPDAPVVTSVKDEGEKDGR